MEPALGLIFIGRSESVAARDLGVSISYLERAINGTFLANIKFRVNFCLYVGGLVRPDEFEYCDLNCKYRLMARMCNMPEAEWPKYEERFGGEYDFVVRTMIPNLRRMIAAAKLAGKKGRKKAGSVPVYL